MTQTVEDIKNDRQTETLPNKINLVNPQQEQHNPKSGSSLIHLDEVNLLKKTPMSTLVSISRLGLSL